jgi:DNA-binding transcriptional ArsR family regulator
MTTVTIDLDPTLLLLKAIADERRLRILSLLAGGERCVCEIRMRSTWPSRSSPFT